MADDEVTSTTSLASGEDLEAVTGGAIGKDDPAAAFALARASEAVRAVCGWHVAPLITETLVVDGPGGRTLFLPTLHIVEVVSVTSDGEPVSLSDVDWSAYGVVEHRRGYWSARRRGVSVELKHGIDPVPAGLKALVCAIAARGIVTGRAAGVKREAAGAESVEYDVGRGGFGLLAGELEELRPYILPGRA